MMVKALVVEYEEDIRNLLVEQRLPGSESQQQRSCLTTC